MEWNEEILATDGYKICYNCGYHWIDKNDELYCGRDGYDTTEDDSCNLWIDEKELEITDELIMKMESVRKW